MTKPNETINTYDIDNNIAPGMLSSPQIAYCVQQYDIIKGFKKSHLGAATYNMRVGTKVLTWEKGEKIEYLLGPEENRNKNIKTKVELRPNSLTFVTTVEEFNLPKDIIARFNLKSKWIHEGLLLGTGPIVDPELSARLLIPLHNFSSQDVTLNFDEEFISVEFTKTLNPAETYPDLEVDIKKDSDLSQDDEVAEKGFLFSEDGTIKYIENDNRLFNFDKYRKRIGRKKVESSVSSKFDQYDKTVKAYDNRLKLFSWVGAITALGTFIALIVLFYNTFMLVDASNTKLEEASAIVKQYQNDNVDLRGFVLKSTYEELKSDFDELKRYTERLYTELYYKSEKMDGKAQREYDSSIEDLKKQIEDLQKEISRLKQGKTLPNRNSQ